MPLLKMMKAVKSGGILIGSGLLLVGGLILCFPSSVQAQKLRAIELHGHYASGLHLRSGEQLQSIDGTGLGVDLQGKLSSWLTIALGTAYSDLTIEQNDPVEQWNWPFWNRFYRNYTRSLVTQDTNYAVVMTPNQHIYMIPVVLTVKGYYPLKKRFIPFLGIGAGIVFYERNLRLNERWSKYFPEIDYTFEYQYDNHAHVKKGQVFRIDLSLGSEYRFAEHFALSGGVIYQYYLVPEREPDFPLKSLFKARLGLVLYY